LVFSLNCFFYDKMKVFIFFYIVLQICLIFTSNIYVDPNSSSFSQDGSQTNPFKTFTSAFSSIVAKTNIIIKSGSIINDLKNDFFVAFPLNIT